MENESSKSLLHGRNLPASFHNETTTEIKVGNRTIQLIEKIDKVKLLQCPYVYSKFINDILAVIYIIIAVVYYDYFCACAFVYYCRMI